MTKLGDMFRIGQSVPFARVVWEYRHDFTFANRPDLRCQYGDAEDSTDTGIRLAILEELNKPSPPLNLIWRYEELTREVVARSRLPWKTEPLVHDLITRMQTEDRQRLASELGISIGSFDKIVRLADANNCGRGAEYGNTILVRQSDGEYKIYEGSHRICALWKQCVHNWPSSLGAFVGFENPDFIRSDV